MFTNLQTKWLNALRNGSYNQGRHRLKGSQGHCCLGVACDVLVREGVIKENALGFTGLNGGELFISSLPPEAMKALNLKHDCGYVEDDHDADLTVLNDSGEHSFEDIANILENNPEKYFTNF